MKVWRDIAARNRREGMNVDDTARSLLAAGASPIDAIKAIRIAFDLDLGEAKVVVHRNLSARDQATAEQLWNAAEQAIRDEA